MKLLLITYKQYRQGVNEVGDIVGRFPNDWKFSKKEIKDFDIIDADISKEEIELVLKGVSLEDRLKTPKYNLRYESGVLKENYSRD